MLIKNCSAQHAVSQKCVVRARLTPGFNKTRRAVAARDSAPKTGQHVVGDALRDEALSFFFPPGAVAKCEPTSGGVNNVVQYVDTTEGKRYILRVYNNGNKTEKVACEHAILEQLKHQTLSFEVPQALSTIADGEPYVVLSSGAAACIFKLIPGSLAKTTSPREVGRATGELCTAMGNVRINMVPPIPPYYDVFKVHHKINRDLFYQDMASNPALNVCREAINYLTAEIRAIEEKLVAFQGLGLPMQLIHGDLHYDNVMVLGDIVSGLLDFEFCAYDWRVMELAVALSKYVGEEDPLSLITEFVSGYAEHGQLTAAEMEIIPDLINLRIFSNVIYFTGRALAKEDDIETLTSRAGSYAKRVRWVNANRPAIVAAIKERMQVLAPVAA